MDFDGLLERGGNIFSYIIRPNRKLTMATVDKNRKLHGFWSTDFTQRIKCCSNGATREEDIVYEDNMTTFNRAWRKNGLLERFGCSNPKIVSVQSDIEDSCGNRDLTYCLEIFLKTFR